MTRDGVGRRAGGGRTIGGPTSRGLIPCGLVIAAILGGPSPAAGEMSLVGADLDSHKASIAGQVYLDGSPPSLAPVSVWKHRWFCGEERMPAALRIGPGGAVADALVVLEGASLPGGGTPTRIQLDNRDCEFMPRVQVAPVGSEVEILSNDPILHTAHAYLDRTETLFHVALPVFLSRRAVRVARPGLVTIECDVGHTWMRAFIWVTATGFATVTDSAGRFRLEAVPPGQYRLRIWHEVLGERVLETDVAAGARLTVAVRYVNGRVRKGGP